MPMLFQARSISSQQSDRALVVCNCSSVSLLNCQTQSKLESGEKSALVIFLDNCVIFADIMVGLALYEVTMSGPKSEL